MAYQITLDDEEYGILAAEIERRGIDLEPEQFLHKMIFKMQPCAQQTYPSTLDELEEQQMLEGKISYNPMRYLLTQEDLEEREQLGQR
jgi:hypothetical protein